MKPYLARLNYSLLAYFFAACTGILLFFYNNADNRYMYILLSLAFIFILTASCFNALTFKRYRTVLWPFLLNMLLLFVFIIANGGIGNVPFFGSNNAALTIFFLLMGFNSHWYMLVEATTVSDFNFLLINTTISFIIPSLGYGIGYLYVSKFRQNATTPCSDSN